jgi:hypothetical protein
VLTEDYEGEEEVDGKRIVYRSLWKWLLEGEPMRILMASNLYYPYLPGGGKEGCTK